MKAIYKFVAGNSRLTPIGVALAATAATLAARADSRVAGIVFLVILILTLVASVYEKER